MSLGIQTQKPGLLMPSVLCLSCAEMDNPIMVPSDAKHAYQPFQGKFGNLTKQTPPHHPSQREILPSTPQETGLF